MIFFKDMNFTPIKRFFSSSRIIHYSKRTFFSILLFLFLILIFLLWSFSPFLSFFWNAGEILGMDEKKTYIITLHNEGELRATHGFITAFLILEIENGEISMDFHDSYDIASPQTPLIAPDIIEEEFSLSEFYEGWVMRDSNFSPLYPENAQKIQEFLQYDTRFSDLDIDGVFAVNLYALGKIIDSVGGVEFHNEKITGDTIFSVLEKEAKNFDHHSFEEWSTRKSSIKPLANIILKKIAFSPFSWRNFSSTVEDMAQKKHLSVYFTNEEIQKKFSQKLWTGEFFAEEDDMLLGYNFSNLGGRKGDRYVRKNFFSTFSVSGKGQTTEKLKIEVNHEGTQNLHSDTYFAYVRIFRPKGTILENYTGQYASGVIPHHVDHSSLPEGEEFSFFFQVEAGESAPFHFDFLYPQSIDINSELGQKFFIFQQSGAVNQFYHIAFQAEGDNVLSLENVEKIKSCDHISLRENISFCDIWSEGDREFYLHQIKDTTPPIFEKKILSDGGLTLTLVFSEDIQPIYDSQVVVKKIGVSLSSEKNKKNWKKIKILSARTEGKNLILKLDQPIHTEENGEKNYYFISVDSVGDNFGNTLAPFENTLQSQIGNP